MVWFVHVSHRLSHLLYETYQFIMFNHILSDWMERHLQTAVLFYLSQLTHRGEIMLRERHFPLVIHIHAPVHYADIVVQFHLRMWTVTMLWPDHTV